MEQSLRCVIGWSLKGKKLTLTPVSEKCGKKNIAGDPHFGGVPSLPEGRLGGSFRDHSFW